MRIDLGLALGVFLEFLIMIYYANTTLYPKKNYIKCTIIPLIGYVLLFIVSLFGQVLLNIILFWIINFLLLFLEYKTSISGALFRSTIMMALCILSEALWVFLLGFTFDVSDVLNVSPEKSMFLTIGSKEMYFIGILIIKSFQKNKNSYSDNSFLALIIIPIITVIAIWLVLDLAIDKKIFVVLCFVFIFANIITFSLNEYIISKNNHIHNLETENTKTQLALDEYRHLSINYEENRLFRHDLKEHIAVLKSLMTEDTSKAIKYMKKIEDISNQTKLEKYSDNSILNILLIQKSRECREKGIELTIKSTNPNINFINDEDIIAIFANLINNAIESSYDSAEKKIFFDLSVSNRTFVVIKVENSCDKEPIMREGVLKTHKEDINNHGIGIRSIKNALNRYDGHMDWIYDKDNKLFKTTILLTGNWKPFSKIN